MFPSLDLKLKQKQKSKHGFITFIIIAKKSSNLNRGRILREREKRVCRNDGEVEGEEDVCFRQ